MELLGENIPISVEPKKKWKYLPIPPRVASVASYLNSHHEQQPHGKNNDPSSTYLSSSLSSSALSSAQQSSALKRVSFSQVDIREHSLTIGDNPSCSFGTPTALDWEVQQSQTLPLEDYEQFRTTVNKRRASLRDLHMNSFRRRELLKQYEYSEDEIRRGSLQVAKVRRQREFTREIMVPLQRVDYWVESTSRRAKRILSWKTRGGTKRSSVAASNDNQGYYLTNSTCGGDMRKSRSMPQLDRYHHHYDV
jgi:hypothetical protein